MDARTGKSLWGLPPSSPSAWGPARLEPGLAPRGQDEGVSAEGAPPVTRGGHITSSAAASGPKTPDRSGLAASRPDGVGWAHER